MAIGLACALALSRYVESLLFGVRAMDPPPSQQRPSTAIVVAAALAGWFPARRAGRVDPVAALRTE